MRSRSATAAHSPTAPRRARAHRSGRRVSSGERVWCFPMDKDFDTDIESTVADVLQCSADSKGDHILAARFLSRFVPQTIPWLHLDLAAGSRHGGLAHIATEITGFGVRYTLDLLRRGWPAGRASMNTLTHSPARRLARAPARRSGARFRREIHRRALRPRHRHAESQAARSPPRPRASAYRERILAALPRASRFAPLMTLYLTDSTAPEEIDRAIAAGFVHGVKLYPAGATTHSDAGVTDIRKTYARARAHGGARHAAAGARRDRARGCRCIRPRDGVHRRDCSRPLLERFTRLKVVFEHITTARAVEFVAAARAGVAATITPQHLLHNRNAIFSGGIRPHYYCLPILKRERDRERSARGRDQRQSALFPRHRQRAARARRPRRLPAAAPGCSPRMRRSSCTPRCSRQRGRLDRLEAFASHFGADFYGLPRHEDRITLIKEPWVPPERYDFGAGTVVPYRGGESVAWRLAPAAAT